MTNPLPPAGVVDIRALVLVLLPGRIALCRSAPTDTLPEWIREASTFLSVTRTSDELSIAADEAAVPAAVDARRGYRAIKVEGPLPFEVVGVIAAIADPLAGARIPILPIATYETDYVLIAEDLVPRAVTALREAGHVVRGS